MQYERAYSLIRLYSTTTYIERPSAAKTTTTTTTTTKATSSTLTTATKQWKILIAKPDSFLENDKRKNYICFCYSFEYIFFAFSCGSCDSAIFVVVVATVVCGLRFVTVHSLDPSVQWLNANVSNAKSNFDDNIYDLNVIAYYSGSNYVLCAQGNGNGPGIHVELVVCIRASMCVE